MWSRQVDGKVEYFYEIQHNKPKIEKISIDKLNLKVFISIMKFFHFLVFFE